jgi:hypothetical protein
MAKITVFYRQYGMLVPAITTTSGCASYMYPVCGPARKHPGNVSLPGFSFFGIYFFEGYSTLTSQSTAFERKFYVVNCG